MFNLIYSFHFSLWLQLVYRPDIYEGISTNLLHEVVAEDILIIVRECVTEMVDDYFIQKLLVDEFEELSQEVMADLIPDVVCKDRSQNVMDQANFLHLMNNSRITALNKFLKVNKQTSLSPLLN